MKHYNQPETNVLQVINSSIVCASGPSLAPKGQLGTMSNGSVQMGTMSTAKSHSF